MREYEFGPEFSIYSIQKCFIREKQNYYEHRQELRKRVEIMSDDAVATATLDRLLHNIHIVSLQDDSYRIVDRINL